MLLEMIENNVQFMRNSDGYRYKKGKTKSS